MTREEAARLLHPDTTAQAMAGCLMDDPKGNSWAKVLNKACEMGAEALQPWVKTSDRLPEGKDAFEDKVLVYNFVERRQQLKLWLIVRTYPHVFPFWMPIPPLPEVEE